MASTHYAVRLDGTDASSMIECLSLLGSYLIVRETVDGDNPHFHALLTSSKDIKAVRNKFVRTVKPPPGVKGNGFYSLTKVADFEKYCRYICKGEDEDTMPEVVAHQGVMFTEDWIHDHHVEYWDVHEQLSKRARDAKVSVFEVVLQRCVVLGVRWDQDVKIAREYIKELSLRNKFINSHSVRSAVNLIKVRLCPDDSAIDALAQIVGDRGL